MTTSEFRTTPVTMHNGTLAGTHPAIRCKLCNTIIMSLHRHDMVFCDCKAIFIDGGSDYTRSGGESSQMEFLAIKTDRLPKGRTQDNRLLH